MEISLHPFTGLPEIQVDEKDLIFFSQQIKKIFKKKDKQPFSYCKDVDGLIKSLYNSVLYLINDQIRIGGIGEGGWGYSDKAYMTFLYGEQEGHSFTDSVMTSVVSYNALRKYGLLTEYFDEKNNSIVNIKENLNRASKYFLSRWNGKNGAGGTFQYVGREREYKLLESFRHTGWLLKVWLTDSCFKDRIIKTANYLIANFEYIDLPKEKVATDVALYISLKDLISNNIFQSELDFNKIKVQLLILESSIIRKYNDAIYGWTSGPDERRGRQLYTLFVLAELQKYVDVKSDDIHNHLTNAYKATFSEGCNYISNNVIALYENGPQDINTTCLALDILNQKSKLNQFEKKIFKSLCEYLIQELGDLESLIEKDIKVYSWTLSYFVNSFCNYLLVKS